MDIFEKIFQEGSSVAVKLYLIAFYFMKYGILGLGIISLNPILIFFGIMFNYMLTVPKD